MVVESERFILTTYVLQAANKKVNKLVYNEYM